MSGPFGAEYYEAEPRVVVLAGGPGVGPAVGIGERAIADDNAVHIVYRATEPVHETRLSALDAAGGTVTITDADGFPAAVDEAVTAAADEQVFVYGFDAFVTAATDAIAAAGGDPDAAKVENFG
mgnify:FL=1